MFERPGARTAEGLVEGRRRGEHAVFRGIPYARSPIGPLRFQAPVPVEEWDGTRQATEFGPVVPQAGPTAESSAGNDWLTLNVSTPAWGRPGCPCWCGSTVAPTSRGPPATRCTTLRP
ncbi:carboxylesterase family protein [Actinoallomurus sp. NBC_01490]|uniref:carboxylesterase family protein n=1 Tax=Actinoallomurus sp. NBC_01490 TaxID=2903557 RepID=UPI003FA4C9A4